MIKWIAVILIMCTQIACTPFLQTAAGSLVGNVGAEVVKDKELFVEKEKDNEKVVD